jgi:outer membrane lipoprotein-sorting protein
VPSFPPNRALRDLARSNALALRRGLTPFAAALLIASSAAQAQTLSPADQAEVARVEAYINRLTTFKADFVQIAPNGATARGTLWISRPGRLRVEYRPPVKLRVFATPQWLIVEDCKVKEPQYLPLRSTPAGLLIQDRIALSGEFTVTRVQRENQWLTITIIETKSPEKGQMRLVFRANPLQLIGWTVIDQNGGPTQVSLENVQAGIPLDINLFGFISKCD